MTNTKKHNSTKTQHRLPLYRRAWFLALIVIAAIAIIVCVIIFLVKPGQQSASSTTKVDDSTEETSVPEDTTINNGQHVNDDQPYSDPDQITIQYEGENPNIADELSGNITYSDYDYNTGILTIGTMISQYINSGTCELRLINNSGNTYTATSEILTAASTSACYDFNIEVAPDYYQIEIVLNSDGKQGTITGEVSL